MINKILNINQCKFLHCQNGNFLVLSLINKEINKRHEIFCFQSLIRCTKWITVTWKSYLLLLNFHKSLVIEFSFWFFRCVLTRRRELFTFLEVKAWSTCPSVDRRLQLLPLLLQEYILFDNYKNNQFFIWVTFSVQYAP